MEDYSKYADLKCKECKGSGYKMMDFEPNPSDPFMTRRRKVLCDCVIKAIQKEYSESTPSRDSR